MEFLSSLTESSEQMDTVFDLAAFCYDYILNFVDGKEALFLATYIYEHEDAPKKNPNMKRLLKFSGLVESIFERQDDEGISLGNCLPALYRAIEKTRDKLAAYGEWDELTVPYYILMAIDRYVAAQIYCEIGPLNKSYRENTYIYFESGNYAIREAAESKSIDFPAVISDTSIGREFEHLIFLKKEVCKNKGIPKVVSLYIDKEDQKRQSLIKGGVFKVAVIPFGRHGMTLFPIKEGGRFTVQYTGEHMKNGIVRAIRLLEETIASGANIIVFPEFICNQEIQEALQEKLKELQQTHPKKIQELLLVIAGTRWSDDDNNICYLYGYDGRCLGRQYKHAHFSDIKVSEKKCVEGLQNPGKETTLIEIDGLGKILTGICKDVSMRTYTKQLADIFFPQFLFVPAWSGSVKNAFSQQLKEITARNHKTCSVVCNCCEAINNQEFREVVGIATIPYKRYTTVVGKEREIKRKQKHCMQCDKGGCFFVLTFDFSEGAVKEGKIIKRMVQRKIN